MTSEMAKVKSRAKVYSGVRAKIYAEQYEKAFPRYYAEKIEEGYFFNVAEVFAEAQAQGYANGFVEKRIELIKKFFALGTPIKIIAKAMGLTEEDILEIVNEDASKNFLEVSDT